MSSTGINYFYNYLGLNPNNFAVFYPFTGQVNSLLPSVLNGNSTYSGLVVGNTGLCANGSGNFNGSSFVQVQNIPNGGFSNNLTFLFTYSKPTTGGGVIFSSLTGTAGGYYSGFNIGVNDANRLYFEYNNGAPVVLTSDVIYGQNNAVAVGVGLNNISFNYYDFSQKALINENFYINSSYLLPSDSWNLGKNICPYLPTLNFSGSMDTFIVTKTSLPTNSLTKLFSGLYSIASGFPSISGTLTNSITTGYQTIFTGTTGINSYTESFSGYSSSNPDYQNLINGYYGEPIYVSTVGQNYYYSGGIVSPITGIPSGYYRMISSGVTGSGDYNPYYIQDSGQIYLYSGGIFSIYTGYVDASLITIEGSFLSYGSNCSLYPVFNIVQNTGYLTSGYQTIPLGNQVTGYYKISDAYTGYIVNTGYENGFGMDYISYLWERNTGDLQEIISITGTDIVGYLGKQAYYDQIQGEFASNGIYQSGNLNLWNNGVLQLESGYSISGQYYNLTVTPIADYYTSGNQYFYSNRFVSGSDAEYYDHSQQQNRYIFYKTGSGYLYSGQLSWGQYHLYLNGLRMVSGIDYTIDVSGAMNFSPQISGISGTIYSSLLYTGEIQQTGRYDRYSGTKFYRESSSYYLNGARIDPSLFIEHSKVDLISGIAIYNGNLLSINDDDDSSTLYWG